jgi:hypothetical protein
MIVGKIGRWKFYTESLTLQHTVSGYPVEFSDIHTSAKMLDTIFQVWQKSWATPQDISDMLRAMYTMLDPQKNYCSWGQSQTVPDVHKLIENMLEKFDKFLVPQVVQ